MRKTKIFCDSCNEEIGSMDVFGVRIGGMDYDHCRICYIKIKDFIDKLKEKVTAQGG